MSLDLKNPIAFNTKINKYVMIYNAQKEDQKYYICPICKKEMILKQRSEKKHHFSHKNPGDNNTQLHNNDNSIHNSAQYITKQLIEDGYLISFNRECISCKTNNLFEIEKITQNSIITLEYGFHFNNEYKKADIVYLENNNIKYIFEIYNTHHTDECE